MTGRLNVMPIRTVLGVVFSGALLTACAMAGEGTETAPPDSDGEDFRIPMVDTIIGCSNGGPYFPASVLDQAPYRPLQDAAGLTEAVELFLANEEGQFWPQEGWLVLHEGQEEAIVVHSAATGDLSFMTLGKEDGAWLWLGAETRAECVLEFRPSEGLNTVMWRLDPDFDPPGPTSTEIRLLLTERECVSGQPPGDRLLEPEIAFTSDAVMISFSAVPPPGGQTCQANPEVAYVLTLDEPLGEREIRDARQLGEDLSDYLS